MLPNNSPWIKQLKRTRPVTPLAGNKKTDIIIVGGGIAGVVTAFFILRTTQKKVILLEADKVAHGATGHNAGQITSYFERSLSSMVEEFGFERALDGQRLVESGWSILEDIFNTVGLQTPFYRFTGHAGCTTKEQVLLHLKNNAYRIKGGLPAESILVAEEAPFIKEIPKEYAPLYKTVPQKDLLTLLETHNKNFIASLSYQKGCMNSALFTEELLGYVVTAHKDQFEFFEESAVATVKLNKHKGVATANNYTVEAQSIILCTNGFENFSIKNNGKDLDTSFHHSIDGRIGYMAGYIEPENTEPTAISYFIKTEPSAEDPTGETYFYLTRRPHEHASKKAHNLICIGGPEKVLPNKAIYSKEAPYPESERMLIEDFLSENYTTFKEANKEFAFSWHGLMGYTPNGIRKVGFEPLNHVLLYNLGCNGVGILPSLMGGKRIANLIAGIPTPLSIFDPT